VRTYDKIETLYNRDEKFKVIEGDYRRPEFALVKEWVVTEKIDGTNIRLQFNRALEGEVLWDVKGKSDNAQIPQPLLRNLENMTALMLSEVDTIMAEHGLDQFCLYGEGYGAKIQHGGGLYRPDQGFILFDVKVGDHIWLAHDKVESIAVRLGLDIVPTLVIASEPVIVKLVKDAYKSTISESDKVAEGVVCKPAYPLYDQRGSRVIWKLKHTDFA
jgi:hypothetical protein